MLKLKHKKRITYKGELRKILAKFADDGMTQYSILLFDTASKTAQTVERNNLMGKDIKVSFEAQKPQPWSRD